MSTKDPFGFAKAVRGAPQKGFFAVLEVDGKVKATAVYTLETIQTEVIPVLEKAYPNAKCRLLPEEAFERITGHKPF